VMCVMLLLIYVIVRLDVVMLLPIVELILALVVSLAPVLLIPLAVTKIHNVANVKFVIM